MQALYGWAGADPDALQQLFHRFAVREFHLPVCRRCPTSHVELANRVKNELADEPCCRLSICIYQLRSAELHHGRRP